MADNTSFDRLVRHSTEQPVSNQPAPKPKPKPAPKSVSKLPKK
jgi:hypothetical protein